MAALNRMDRTDVRRLLAALAVKLLLFDPSLLAFIVLPSAPLSVDLFVRTRQYPATIPEPNRLPVS